MQHRLGPIICEFFMYLYPSDPIMVPDILTYGLVSGFGSSEEIESGRYLPLFIRVFFDVAVFDEGVTDLG